MASPDIMALLDIASSAKLGGQREQRRGGDKSAVVWRRACVMANILR